MNEIQPSQPVGIWAEQLSFQPEEIHWIWQGFLARSAVTLFTSQWKSGKTTLVSVLLSKLAKGGSFLGLDLKSAKAVVLSEESSAHWRNRNETYGFQGHLFFCRPFHGKPELPEWREFLARLEELHREHGFGLLIVDTIATLLPGRSEASASAMMEALYGLQRFARLGPAVLLLHHPRKGNTLPGQASRGSGALPAFADIIIEMSFCPHSTPGTPDNDRRRKLLAFSRYEQTPTQLVIELNEDCRDYSAHGDFNEDDFHHHWQILQLVLQDVPGKRTRDELLNEWPADFDRPAPATLWRRLSRAVHLGLLQRQGSGRRHDPFRYWLPAAEEEWKKDPLCEFLRMQEESSRLLEQSLARCHSDQ